MRADTGRARLADHGHPVLAMQTEYRFEQPLVRLLNKITKRAKFKHIYVKSKELHLELNSKTHELH